MSWTDEEIDKLFQAKSDDVSFEYKDEYWQELSATLPVSAPVTSGLDSADNEIDKLYQAKADELSFAYKSSYWKEIAAMLPGNRKIDILWYAASFVFIGLLLMTPLVNNESETNPSPALADANAANDASQQNGASVDIASDNVIGDVDGNSEVNSTSNNVAVNNNKANNTVAITTSNNSVTSNTATSNSVTNNSVTNNAVTNNIVTDNIVTDNSVTNPSVNNTTVNATNNTTTNTTTVVNPANPAPVPVKIAVRNNKTGNKVANGNKDPNNSPEVAPTKADLEVAKNGNDVDKTIGNLSTVPLERTAIDKNIMPYTIDHKMPSKANLYLELNGGLSQSLITPSKEISYAVGVGIGTQIQKGKFTFVAGLNGIMSNHNDIELSRQAKVYGFGSEVYNYELKYKQLYSLEAMLSVGYKLGRHSISLGVRPSYVIGSKVGYNTVEDEIPGETRVMYGYIDGINRFGIKPMLGYSVDLSKNLVLGVNVGMQLMPSVNEDFINGVNNKLPIDGQIYVRKSIRFKK